MGPSEQSGVWSFAVNTSNMATRAKKRFGQHWLKDEQILNHIVASADVSEGDRILEIGPGTGLLTRRMVPYAERVVAVEEVPAAARARSSLSVANAEAKTCR